MPVENISDDVLGQLCSHEFSYDRLLRLALDPHQNQSGYVFAAFPEMTAIGMGWNAIFIAEMYDGSCREHTGESHYVGIQLASIAITRYVPVYPMKVHFQIKSHGDHDAYNVLTRWEKAPMMFVTSSQCCDIAFKGAIERNTWLRNARKFLSQNREKSIKKFFTIYDV